jgi:hypothetical protein
MAIGAPMAIGAGRHAAPGAVPDCFSCQGLDLRNLNFLPLAATLAQPTWCGKS